MSKYGKVRIIKVRIEKETKEIERCNDERKVYGNIWLLRNTNEYHEMIWICGGGNV